MNRPLSESSSLLWPRVVRLFRRLLIVVCLFLTFQLVANHILGARLSSGFSRGTGCIVKLENPWLHFFPLRGSVENAQIRCPNEAPNEGFSARQISVRLHFFSLFYKKVLLRDLEIFGAHAISRTAESGFLRTISFVTTAPPASRKTTAHWYSFLTSNWSLHLDNLRVTADDEQGPELVIKTNTYEFMWDNPKLLAQLDARKEVPNFLYGTASNFSFLVGKSPSISLGPFEGRAIVHHRTIQFPTLVFGKTLPALDAAFGPPGQTFMPVIAVLSPQTLADTQATNFIEGSGTLQYQADVAYDFSLTAELNHDYLATMVSQRANLMAQLEPTVRLTGHVGGALTRPTLSGALQLVLNKPLPLFKREACALKHLQAEYTIDSEALAFHHLQIENITEDTSFQLEFNPALSFTGQMTMNLNRDKKIVENCLELEQADSSSSIAASLREAVSDSHSVSHIQGTFSPLFFEGTSQAELHLSTGSVRSDLQSDYSLRDNILHLTINERGVLPHIQSAPVLQTATRLPSYQTPFQITAHSIIDAELNYSLLDQKIDVRRLSISNYPAARLLARFAPFLEERTFRFFAGTITPDSTIDSSLTLAYQQPSQQLALNGSLALSQAQYLGLPLKKVSLAVRSDKNAYSIDNILLESEGGEMRGDLKISPTTDLQGRLTGTGFSTDGWPAWKEQFPLFHATINGEADVSGVLAQPKIKAAILVHSHVGENTEQPSASALNVTVEKHLLSVDAQLFDGRGTALLSYPLDGVEEVSFSGHANQLPLTPFLLRDESNLNSTSGEVSGEFRFHGPQVAPLLGQGSLNVSQLSVRFGETLISQARPLAIKIDQGRLAFTDCTFLVDNQELRLVGEVTALRGWESSIAGNWAVKGFSSGALEHFAADIVGRIDIKGPVTAPLLSGVMALKNGSLSFPVGEAVIGINDLGVDAVFNGEDLEFRHLVGHIGEGNIKGTGLIRKVLHEKKREMTGNIEFADVSVEPLRNMSLNADAHLSFSKGPLAPSLVSGDIHILDALYENTVDLKQVVRAITDTITGRRAIARAALTGKPANDVRFDIRVHGENSLVIETNVMRGELAADVRVSDSLFAPKFVGEIHALDGTFGFQSSDFEIVNANLTFPEGAATPDPILDIVGETNVNSREGEEYQVQLSISGTLTKPQLVFSSNSGIPERDLVYLLTLGARVQEVNLLGGQKRTRALTYSELLDPSSDLALRERVGGLIGFSEVDVSARSAFETGAYVPTITAHRPVTDKIDFTLKSELVGNQLGEAQLNYGLTPYLGVIAAWKTRPATNPNSDTGNFEIGLGYKRTFPGLTLFPRKLSQTKD